MRKIPTIDIAKPEEARAYIDSFRSQYMPDRTGLMLEDGTKIEFASMSDDDAVHIAHLLLHLENDAATRNQKH